MSASFQQGPSGRRPDIERFLVAGIRAARAGRRELDPLREEAWLWLAELAEDGEDAAAYLYTVLSINPQNRQAQRRLRQIEGRSPSVILEAPAAKVQPRLASTAHRPLPDGGVSLSVEQAEAIDRCLDKIAYESEARCIILADMTGRLIGERGQTCSMNTQVLSALAAGELVATYELARLVGEPARFKLLLHEGEQHSVYLSDIGEQLILIIVFDNDTPIGLVRMVLREVVEELTPLLRSSSPMTEPFPHEQLADDFTELLKESLDSALDPPGEREPDNHGSGEH